MGDVLDLSESLWNGSISTETHNPVMNYVGTEVLSDDLAFACAFGNVSAFRTDEGLLVVDTGGSLVGGVIVQSLRHWSTDPVHTVVYTHGHLDHVCGVQAFEKDAKERGHSPFTVVGHNAVLARFDRYRLTGGYNSKINARQFSVTTDFWPTEYREPDRTITEDETLVIGDNHFQLRHDKGETDDHVWVWSAKDRVLCTGDLFIWASPNCGNPQKAQRYPKEWAAALKKMEMLRPELLLPGHGPPILGEKRIAQALSDTRKLLETIHDQVLSLMNEGATLNDILHSVIYPDDLLQRPYLRPVYDEPSFMVRNIWRLYGGWYDGNPARLKPPEDKVLAKTVAALAGGAQALIAAAEQHVSDGKIELACQLVEWAHQADPGPATLSASETNIQRASRGWKLV